MISEVRDMVHKVLSTVLVLVLLRLSVVGLSALGMPSVSPLVLGFLCGWFLLGEIWYVRVR